MDNTQNTRPDLVALPYKLFDGHPSYYHKWLYEHVKGKEELDRKFIQLADVCIKMTHVIDKNTDIMTYTDYMYSLLCMLLVDFLPLESWIKYWKERNTDTPLLTEADVFCYVLNLYIEEREEEYVNLIRK